MKQLAVERIEIVDAEGKVRMVLGTDNSLEGQSLPYVAFKDPSGQDLLSLRLVGDAASPELILRSPNGRMRASLSLDDGAGVLGLGRDIGGEEYPGEVVYEAMIGATRDGEAVLSGTIVKAERFEEVKASVAARK